MLVLYLPTVGGSKGHATGERKIQSYSIKRDYRHQNVFSTHLIEPFSSIVYGICSVEVGSTVYGLEFLSLKSFRLDINLVTILPSTL